MQWAQSWNKPPPPPPIKTRTSCLVCLDCDWIVHILETPTVKYAKITKKNANFCWLEPRSVIGSLRGEERRGEERTRLGHHWLGRKWKKKTETKSAQSLLVPAPLGYQGQPVCQAELPLPLPPSSSSSSSPPQTLWLILMKVIPDKIGLQSFSYPSYLLSAITQDMFESLRLTELEDREIVCPPWLWAAPLPPCPRLTPRDWSSHCSAKVSQCKTEGQQKQLWSSHW